MDGLVYSSTLVDEDSWYIDGDLKLDRFKRNIALFTKYNFDNPTLLDDDLLKKFFISAPITKSDAFLIPNEESERLKGIIARNTSHSGLRRAAEFSGISHATYFDDLVTDEAGKKTSYSSHAYGQIQAYMLYVQQRKLFGEIDVDITEN